jgi:hypothetical protein
LPSAVWLTSPGPRRIFAIRPLMVDWVNSALSGPGRIAPFWLPSD